MSQVDFCGFLRIRVNFLKFGGIQADFVGIAPIRAESSCRSVWKWLVSTVISGVGLVLWISQYSATAQNPRFTAHPFKKCKSAGICAESSPALFRVRNFARAASPSCKKPATIMKKSSSPISARSCPIRVLSIIIAPFLMVAPLIATKHLKISCSFTLFFGVFLPCF